jgi:D-arginine dehydrogenase
METARIVIVGAGICGAATAYFLAAGGETDIVVLEAEDIYNRHSSGRSASYFVPMYETRLQAALAQRAEPFLAAPPEGFTAYPLLDRRGAILIADESTLRAHEAEVATARALGIAVEPIEPARIRELIPIARPQSVAAAAYYPGGAGIDAHALSMGYIAAAKRAGVRFALERRYVGAARNGRRIGAALTNAGPIGCDVIVNAAGAWAGEVAWHAGAAPIGVQPKRRHVICVPMPKEHAHARWPFLRAPSIPLYFRPEAGQLLASAMDAEPFAACDCPTDEMAIATVAAAVSANTTLAFDRIASSWAGLRVFSRDGAPVVGWDAAVRGFLWVACTGGTGIQSSPAIGQIAANLLLECGGEDPLAAQMDPMRYAKG